VEFAQGSGRLRVRGCAWFTARAWAWPTARRDHFSRARRCRPRGRTGVRLRDGLSHDRTPVPRGARGARG